jgi:hypothetical protein
LSLITLALREAVFDGVEAMYAAEYPRHPLFVRRMSEAVEPPRRARQRDARRLKANVIPDVPPTALRQPPPPRPRLQNAIISATTIIGEIEGMLGLIDISQFTAPPPPKA